MTPAHACCRSRRKHSRRRSRRCQTTFCLTNSAYRLSAQPATDQVLKRSGAARAICPAPGKVRVKHLVARPDFEGGANLFLELNLTKEVLKFDPIATSIPQPWRGTERHRTVWAYLPAEDQRSDHRRGAAHRAGIWVSVPNTTEIPTPTRQHRADGLDPAPPQRAAGRRCGVHVHGRADVGGGKAAAAAARVGGGRRSAARRPGPVPAAQAVIFFGGSPMELRRHRRLPRLHPTRWRTRPRPQSQYPRDVPPIMPPAITQALVNDPIIFLQQAILQQLAEGHSSKARR